MDERQDLISVILPVYNVENYLCQCLESIIGQEYSKLEIILVDDGSTDSSGAICDKFARLDKRINVIHKENGGLVRARKTGLNVATGKYVIFVDSDDYIEPDLCSSMVTYIIESEADFFHANFYDNGTKVFNGIKQDCIYVLTDKEKERFIETNILGKADEKLEKRNTIFPSIWSKIFEREFIIECYSKVPDMQSYGEDFICLCHMIFNCKKMGVTTKPFYHYRIREGSMSHGDNYGTLVNLSKMCDCLENVFREYRCSEEVYETLKSFYKAQVQDVFFDNKPQEIHMNRYYSADLSKIYNKKIILYGAGRVGFDIYDQLCRYENITILDWVDKNYEKISCEYRKIKGLNRLKSKDYDMILVAVEKEQLFEAISADVRNMGIIEKQIVWCNPKQYIF